MQSCPPFVFFAAVLFCTAAFCTAAAATPLQDCAPSTVPSVCLDAKLKAANKQLNTTLKAAQERLEQLQAHGRRPVLGAFIDSQRKFNAYRDAQCNWQGVRAAPGANSADYVKDCQIRATLAREQELAEFIADDSPAAAAATDSPPPVQADASEPATPAQSDARAESTAQPPAPVDALPSVARPDEPVASEAPPRTNEWRLLKWVANGAEKPVVPDSVVTIAFDPSGKISGNASVNRFNGTYRFDVDGRLQWPRGGFSLSKQVGPRALMAQERAFLESLRRTTQYRVDGQQLVLESQNGATVLVFTR